MPKEIIPADIAYEDWIESIDLPDLVGEVDELAEFLPYAKHIVAAYRWFRGLRAKQFLRALSTAADTMDERKKEKLRDVLNSKEGAEVLADYVKAVLHTSSHTAIISLALLYSDADDERYSRSFKLSAVMALEGIFEDSINAYLALSQVETFIPDRNQPNVPYPVAVANDGLIQNLQPSARKILEPPEARVVIISDLIRRGLLLPDFASARWGEGGLGLTFGVSGEVKKFADLIRRSKELLPSL